MKFININDIWNYRNRAITEMNDIILQSIADSYYTSGMPEGIKNTEFNMSMTPEILMDPGVFS